MLSLDLYEVFTSCFIETLNSGAGAITTKTAANIASNLAIGYLSPVMAQIDPLRVGEISRSVKIAKDYGTRLSPTRQETINILISKYSSHSFVIDYDEAITLFGDAVRQPQNLELILEKLIYGKIRHPDDSEVWIFDLSELENAKDLMDEESAVSVDEIATIIDIED